MESEEARLDDSGFSGSLADQDDPQLEVGQGPVHQLFSPKVLKFREIVSVIKNLPTFKEENVHQFFMTLRFKLDIPAASV